MANAVGGATMLHARETLEQACWAQLEVHQEVFADLKQHLLHSILQTDPVGPSLIDDESLIKFLNSGPLQGTINILRQPAPSTATPKQPPKEKHHSFHKQKRHHVGGNTNGACRQHNGRN